MPRLPYRDPAKLLPPAQLIPNLPRVWSRVGTVGAPDEVGGDETETGDPADEHDNHVGDVGRVGNGAGFGAVEAVTRAQ